MNIYSNIQPTTILHIINRKRDIPLGRVDLVEPEQFMQVATIRQPGGTTYRPHRHIVRPLPHEGRAQEAWIVVSGLVNVTLYDLDNSVLHRDVLEAGDISISLEAGHNYEIVGENTVVYEVKTGPYFGQHADKIFI